MSCEAGLTLGCALEVLDKIGVLGGLVLILAGLHRQWWVPGWVYRDLERREQESRRLAWNFTDLAKQGVEITRSAVEKT